MIKFSQRDSLNDPGYIFLSWTIHKQTKIQSRKIKKEQVNGVKNGIARQEVINMATRLYKWRAENYLHSPNMREAAIIALIDLEKLVPAMNEIHNLKGFFDYTVNRIIPLLREVAPGRSSKYVNFAPALEALEAFSLKCQAYFTQKENERNLQIINGEPSPRNVQYVQYIESQQVNKFESSADLFSITS